MQTQAMETPSDAVGAEANTSRVVLFDFDGVLIHGDAFSLFVRHRYAHSWLCKILVVLTLPWCLLVLPFSRKWAIRTWVHVAVFGLSERRYRAMVEAFADQLVRRPGQFCRDALQALRRHQAAGDRVIVVTGCEHVLVSRLLVQLGLSEVEVVASTLRPGWLGMRISRRNVGRRKVQNLAEIGVKSWRLAYSDSSQDLPMLKVAAEPVLVNATPKLCKRVERALGRSTTRVEWY
jgi:phosphatidylglycerophosphatase C